MKDDVRNGFSIPRLINPIIVFIDFGGICLDRSY